MYDSTNAQVHQQVQAMEKSSLTPRERPFMVDLGSVCLSESSHATCTSTLDLELHCDDGSDAGSSDGSESEYVNARESIFSHDNVTGQTETTTVDDDYDVDAARSSDTMLGRDKQDQDMWNSSRRENRYEGPANIVPVIHFSGLSFSDGEIVSLTPGSARTVTYMDQHPTKLEQSGGPARHYYQLGIGHETPGPDAEQAIGTHTSTGQVNALWKHPEKSNSEIREAINEVKRLDLLPATTLSSHPHGIIRKDASGPSTTTSGTLVPAAHSRTTGGEPPPMEADWEAPPSPSDVARQARMNETRGMIYRMMPREREIHFDVDMNSFWRAGFNPEVTVRIEHAARLVVFRIRYDPTITGDTLALAFFPGDRREHWQVRHSSTAAASWASGGRLEYMHNILAHEFMHILGFRHWNAGFDVHELQLPSVHLPGTDDRDCKSIMYTSVHDRLWFNKEDFRTIRRVYSAPGGERIGDCLINDVDPYV